MYLGSFHRDLHAKAWRSLSFDRCRLPLMRIKALRSQCGTFSSVGMNPTNKREEKALCLSVPL